MKIGQMCLNWKVLAGLATVGLGVFLFEPQLFVRAFPVLLVAACPLSMIVMMWGMRSGVSPSAPEQATASAKSAGPYPATAEPSAADLRQQLADLEARQAQMVAKLNSLQSSSGAADRALVN